MAAAPGKRARAGAELHVPWRGVYDQTMERLNITLADEDAAKLARLAARMHVQPGTVARSLLARALEEADPEPRNVVELLDGISGAHERAQQGLSQARAGQTIGLDQL